MIFKKTKYSKIIILSIVAIISLIFFFAKNNSCDFEKLFKNKTNNSESISLDSIKCKFEKLIIVRPYIKESTIEKEFHDLTPEDRKKIKDWAKADEIYHFYILNKEKIIDDFRFLDEYFYIDGDTLIINKDEKILLSRDGSKKVKITKSNK